MKIPTTPFGSSGHHSTRCIFGGTALSRASQEEADRTLELLLRYGINHIDTAAGYGDSELRIAPWMRRHRHRFFLATKTGERSAAGAREQLERSLQRLQVERVDLIQLHSLTEPEDWHRALGSGGALEALIRAREEGLVRYIGVTGHGVTVARMHLNALQRHPFDAVLLPLNLPMFRIPEYAADFRELRELCRQRGVAVQTIKAIARRRWTGSRAPPSHLVRAARRPAGHRRRRALGPGTRGRFPEHRRRHDPAAAHPRCGRALQPRRRQPCRGGRRRGRASADAAAVHRRPERDLTRRGGARRLDSAASAAHCCALESHPSGPHRYPLTAARSRTTSSRSTWKRRRTRASACR